MKEACTRRSRWTVLRRKARQKGRGGEDHCEEWRKARQGGVRQREEEQGDEKDGGEEHSKEEHGKTV